MARYFLCEECVKNKQPGTRQIYARSELGEPAEFERVTIGIAGRPNRDQRYIAVNGVRENLDLSYYNCDTCNAEVKPGDRCGARTIWTEATGPIANWEHEYLTADDNSLAQGTRLRPAGGKQ